MNSVAKKSGTSKKAARDGRILARSRREEQPVSREITRAAGRAGIKAKPDPMLLTGAAFNGGAGFHKDATIADLIVLMFEAPNRTGRSISVTPDGFVEDVLLCSADEVELISCTAHEQGIADEVERIMLRANWRARVALELAKRMREAAARQPPTTVALEGNAKR